jgi:DNA polymerase III subunit alpha
VAKFAGYGFNKSHAACYAIVAYQTAYLKANFPVEFIAASMTLDLGNSDKLQLFRREAMRLKVPIDPPAINASGVEFAVSDGVIKYSLAALKNVGRGAVEHVVADARGGRAVRARSATSPAGSMPGRSTSARWRAWRGPGPSTRSTPTGRRCGRRRGHPGDGEPHQRRQRAGPEQPVRLGRRGGGGGRALPVTETWPLMERLAAEFETVGFYLSGHPLDDYMPALKRMGVETWASFHDKAVKKGASAAKMAGTVIHRQERRSKSGNRFAFVGLSDPTGQYEAICFSDTLAQARDLLEPGTSVLGRFEADVDGEEVRLRLQSVEVLDAAAAQVAGGMVIVLGDASPVAKIAEKLGNGGRAPVRVVLHAEGGRQIDILLGNRFTVTPQLKSAFKALPGVLDVQDL